MQPRAPRLTPLFCRAGRFKMCPRCKHGPIEHYACANLRTHVSETNVILQSALQQQSRIGTNQRQCNHPFISGGRKELAGMGDRQPLRSVPILFGRSQRLALLRCRRFPQRRFVPIAALQRFQRIRSKSGKSSDPSLGMGVCLHGEPRQRSRQHTRRSIRDYILLP